MGLNKMTIADNFGNTADVEAGKLTALNVPLEGFRNIDDFAKEVRGAMLKTTPEGTEPDPSIVQKKQTRGRKVKGVEKSTAGSAQPRKSGKDKDKNKDKDKPSGAEGEQPKS